MNRRTRHLRLAAAACLVSVPLASICAQGSSGLKFIDLQALKWLSVPISKDMKSATVVGDPTRTGEEYVLRAHYPAGATSIPHTHPDQRVVTVISGKYYQGFGPVFDKQNARLVEPGGMVVIPANTPHFGWAETDSIVQESGIGPTGTKPIEAK